jgi:hypothetical protein
MRFRNTVVADSVSVAASSVNTFDLPVNPISHLVFTMKFLNVTDEATLAQILARLSNIQVSRFGQQIFNMSGADLQKMNAILFKSMPIVANQVATDNAARYVSLIIPFSRILMNPAEGIGATQRGELKLQVTMSSSETDVDNVSLQVEAVEMLGATPKRYLKSTTLSYTTVSGVDNDIPLPIGNQYVGLGVFSTTVPTGTSFTASAQKMRLMLDNVETDYVATTWESLHGALLNRIGHREVYDASADNDDVANYALLDFSPTNDDNWLIDTKGLSMATLKVTAGDTGPVRVFPLELVSN